MKSLYRDTHAVLWKLTAVTCCRNIVGAHLRREIARQDIGEAVLQWGRPAMELIDEDFVHLPAQDELRPIEALQLLAELQKELK